MSDSDARGESRADDALAAQLLQRAEQLKAKRHVFAAHWDEIQRFIRPLAAKATNGPLGQDAPGTKNRQEILDNSSEAASDLLVNAIYGSVMNPGTRFFGLAPVDRVLRRDRAVMAWLEMAVDDLHALLAAPATRFPEHAKSFLGELVDFGTSGLYVSERDGRAPLIQARPLAELYLAEGEDGAVDTVYRNPSMTARQAVQLFGRTLPEAIQQRAEKQPDDAFAFWHCVWPTRELPKRLRPRGINGEKPFASYWVSEHGRKLVRMQPETQGFEEMPYITPRFDLRAGEVYGRGPGMKALADVKMLQRAMRSQIRGVEKSIDPPMVVADDGIVGPVRINAGSLIFAEHDLMTGSAMPIRPLESGARPDLGDKFMDGVRLRIDNAYYKHILLLPRDPRMPATHILKLDEEQAKILGPFLGPVQSQGVAPLIWRLFMIRLRAGIYGDLPPALQGREVNVEYESQTAKAQRLGEARASAQTVEATAQLAQMKPEAWDLIDEDEFVRITAESTGAPSRLLRDPRKVAQIRDARAQARRQAAQASMAADAAKALQSGGQAAAALAGAARTAGMVPEAANAA